MKGIIYELHHDMGDPVFFLTNEDFIHGGMSLM